MFIQFDQLFAKDDNRIEKQVPWDEEVFSSAKGVHAIVNQSPVEITLVHTAKKHLLLDVHMDLVLSVPCDRCLKAVSVPFSVQMHKEINCNQLDEDSDDAQYIEENALNIGKMIQDEILLQWPEKILCKKDCRGICRVCGHDLNVSDCDCDRVVLDPRMAAIQDIFNQAGE